MLWTVQSGAYGCSEIGRASWLKISSTCVVMFGSLQVNSGISGFTIVPNLRPVRTKPRGIRSAFRQISVSHFGPDLFFGHLAGMQIRNLLKVAVLGKYGRIIRYRRFPGRFVRVILPFSDFLYSQ